MRSDLDVFASVSHGELDFHVGICLFDTPVLREVPCIDYLFLKADSKHHYKDQWI